MTGGHQMPRSRSKASCSSAKAASVGGDPVSDWLPCVLPHSQRVHLAPLFTAPALCRPDGPPPTWYSPYRQMGHSDEQCPRCVALAQAAADLDRLETEVAEW